MTSVLRWGRRGGQHHAPTALPPGKTRYPLYRRLGGPQGRSGPVRKISPPPTGFRSPYRPARIESRYTDWGVPAHVVIPEPWTKHYSSKVLDIRHKYFGSYFSIRNRSHFSGAFAKFWKKKDLASSCLSDRPSFAWNTSAATGRIFMKFDIFENLSREF